MYNMTLMLRHQLKKRIEVLNTEFDKEFFSTNLEDYLFVKQSKNRDNVLTITFLDMKNERELTLNVKVIE